MPIAESITRATQTFLGILHARIELASMDLADEFRAAMGVFLAATAAVVLAMFAVFFGSLAIVALFWDEHGIASVVYVSAAYAIAAILIALLVRRFLDHKRPFLAATLEELDKDRQRIGLR